jgi:hypothetical protein
VLRREERAQARTPQVGQQVDGVPKAGVHRRLMGEDTETTAAQETEAMPEQDVETRLNA